MLYYTSDYSINRVQNLILVNIPADFFPILHHTIRDFRVETLPLKSEDQKSPVEILPQDEQPVRMMRRGRVAAIVIKRF